MNSNTFKPPSINRWQWLPVIDRMVSLELARTVTAVLLVLVAIIVSRKFLGILTKAIEGEVAGDTLFILLGLKSLTVSIVLMPAALFLAILMVFGRMYRDQEMSILASGGVGFLKLYRTIAWFVLPLSLIAAFLSLQVMPWTESQVQALLKNDAKSADVRGIKPGRFSEFSRGDVVLYAESMDETNGSLSHLFIQSRNHENTGIIVAKTGHLIENGQGEHFVVLNDGERHQGIPGKLDYIISKFDEYAIKIEVDETAAAEIKLAAVSSLNLWAAHTPFGLAELQRRFAIPLGVLFLSLLAVPISRVAPRGGVYGNVLTAFLIYLAYENLQRVSQGLLITQKIPLWLSYSGVYIAMLGLSAFFLLRASGLAWIWQILRQKVRL